MNKRAVLLEKIKKEGFPQKEIFISIEDFFDGNEDDGSIGANIYPDPPSLLEFYNTLKEIRNATKTDTLFVRIADVDDTDWFYSDTIYISGDYTLTEVKNMFKSLKPDDIYEGRMYDGASNIPPIIPGNKAYSIWWD
ncbi:MAG: hypothetical protein JWR09_569 [Mucilaginibacter sp.]|nr:hypothetical protein [Mucilaginibacter sp.]